MAETLEALAAFLGRGASRPKLVVWAHNSHLGDARATDMSRHGEHNVGQLVRTRHGSDAVLIGFTTATGSVTAASDWDAPVERKTVRAPLGGSIEALFHEVAHPDFLLDLRRPGALRTALSMGYLERAIGAIYRPETERQSHYFGADLAHQFDAVLHYDRTHALEPLERTGLWNAGELPATYPSGL
jgi:erythromycin esterase-like protein